MERHWLGSACSRREALSLMAGNRSIDSAVDCNRWKATASAAATLASEVESEDLSGPVLLGQVSLGSPQSVQGNGRTVWFAQDCKRKRVAEQHNKSEQRRRRKINAKLDELQAMVPFSRSREKASILLDVIEYIKSVQAQLHIMSAIASCDYAAYCLPVGAPPEANQHLQLNILPSPLVAYPAFSPAFVCPLARSTASGHAIGGGTASSGSVEDGDLQEE